MTQRFDVVVVGAGPGGMAAATVAAEAGRRVCVVDDNPAAGGQIWRGAAVGQGSPEAQRWLKRLLDAGCTIWPGMRVVAVVDECVLRVEGSEGVRDVAWEKLILATGARERFLPFPGWTLPGVMGAGAAQAFLKSGLEVRGRRAVVAGSGPLLLAVGAALRKKGAQVAAICEQAPLARLVKFGCGLWRHPEKLGEGWRYRVDARFAPYHASCWVVRAEGGERVERVTLTNGHRQWVVECDLLACGFHLVPNLELPRLLGCEVRDGLVSVDERQMSSRRDVFCVGELTGVGGLEKALVEGEIAGWAATENERRVLAMQVRRKKLKRFAERLELAFALRPELRALPEDETIVCRCEDVTHQAVCGRRGWRDAKLHTRIGMGPCQGRVCGAAAEFLFGWELRETRPPVFPATSAAMAAGVDRSEE
jgi:D-hydroxyproline dehydrogenase subunit alpha